MRAVENFAVHQGFDGLPQPRSIVNSGVVQPFAKRCGGDFG